MPVQPENSLPFALEACLLESQVQSAGRWVTPHTFISQSLPNVTENAICVFFDRADGIFDYIQ